MFGHSGNKPYSVNKNKLIKQKMFFYNCVRQVEETYKHKFKLKEMERLPTIEGGV